MDVTVTAVVEHRSSSQQGIRARNVADGYLPLPGASSCCGSGCCCSSSCCCSW
jgi:hypothetical protein